jgi:DNA-binding CsgD family transcriptional regulator
MKRTALYCLLILYVVFVSIDFLSASRIAPMPPTVILRLIFSLGCLIWIHLDRKDIFETVDFDLIRVFLLFMFITDFIFGTFATLEGPIGRIFFTTGIVSASFGQFALILRHLRSSTFSRLKSIGAVSLNISSKVQFRYLLVFSLMEAAILFIGLMSGSIDSSPFVAFYLFVSLALWVCAFLYLFSENQKRSRFLAFSGVSLLIISDSFTGLGIAILKDWPYLTLVIWALYAPVLLLIGSSIHPPKKELRNRFSLAGSTSHAGGIYFRGKEGFPMANLNSLTKRELELLKLLLQGKSNKQIAAALNISEHTVEFHLRNIYRKLGMSSKAEAMALVKSLGDP